MHSQNHKKISILFLTAIFVCGSGLSRADHQPKWPPSPEMQGCTWFESESPEELLLHDGEQNDYGESCTYEYTQPWDKKPGKFPGWFDKSIGIQNGVENYYLGVKQNCIDSEGKGSGASKEIMAQCPEPPVAPAVQPPPSSPQPEDDYDDCPECEKVEACFDAGGSSLRCCSIHQNNEIRKECMLGPMDCPECSEVDTCFEKGGSPERCCSIIGNLKEQEICLKN